GYASEYRNHAPKHILAVNDRTVPPANITVRIISQDDPANTQQEDLIWPAQSPPVVFGGRIPTTADNLILQANFDSPPIANGCRWYVRYRPFTPGASSNYSYFNDYNAPKNTVPIWDVDIKPIPGLYIF